MALADYYNQAALAASQAITGFKPELFQSVIEGTSVGLAVDRTSSASFEGRALTELAIRLLARLYPNIELRIDDADFADQIRDLALRINPHLDWVENAAIGICVGDSTSPFVTTIYAGSFGWDAFVSMTSSVGSGLTLNPFGAGAAACLAVSQLFNALFLDDRRPVADQRLSTFDRGTGNTSQSIPSTGWSLADHAVLVGAGAIGNATAWALSMAPITGTIHLIDHQTVELTNLQRYVLANRADELALKVEMTEAFFLRDLRCIPHSGRWATFVEQHGYHWPVVLVALDSARDRRAVQASLPKWVANAWTQPGDLGISLHSPFDSEGACLACLYLPETRVKNQDEVVAEALGIPGLVRDVRRLLVTGEPVARQLLDVVAQVLQLSAEAISSYEGRTIFELYREGICGGGLIPLGGQGHPHENVHVPMAHQSALAGVLLGAALVRHSLTGPPICTAVTRIDLTRQLHNFLTAPEQRAGTKLCICEDADFVKVYQSKYESA